jgi:hypothetical protein
MKARHVLVGVSKGGVLVAILVWAGVVQGSLFGSLSSRYVVGDPNKANPISDTEGPKCIAAGDFNGDGLVELVVANRNVNTISVLRGLGAGWFSPPCEFPSGTSPRYFVSETWTTIISLMS